MKESDDPDYKEDDNYKPSCRLCQGTGFDKGKICFCITGMKDGDVLDFLKSTFGMKK